MKTKMTRPLTRIELQAILSLAKPYWRHCIILGFATGLRLVDLLQLQKDLTPPRFIINESKTGKIKVVNLPSWSIDSFVYLAKYSNNPLYLLDVRDKSSYRKMIKKLSIDAGLNPLGIAWHSLRKTIASQIAERSGISAAQIFLNHSSASTTMHYISNEIISLEQIYTGFIGGL